jgi:hypothetical protein
VPSATSTPPSMLRRPGSTLSSPFKSKAKEAAEPPQETDAIPEGDSVCAFALFAVCVDRCLGHRWASGYGPLLFILSSVSCHSTFCLCSCFFALMQAIGRSLTQAADGQIIYAVVRGVGAHPGSAVIQEQGLAILRTLAYRNGAFGAFAQLGVYSL